jgi:hypothetical protein
MIRVAQADGRFTSVQTETYGEWPGWTTGFDLAYLQCSGPSGSTWFNQVTSTSNTLVRYTCFRDPSTGIWTSWTPVDPNVLQ